MTLAFRQKNREGDVFVFVSHEWPFNHRDTIHTMRTNAITMKSLVTLLLIANAIIVPLSARAEQEGDFTYFIKDNAVTISNYTGEKGVVTIPDQIANLPVRAIGDNAFNQIHINTKFTSITIPSTVTTIGSGAFFKCIGLTSLSIPHGVINIEKSAFDGCSGLTTLTIPSSVVNIGNNAFGRLPRLTEVTIPAKVASIGVLVFHGEGLKAITVEPDNLKYCSVDGVLFDKKMAVLVAYPAGKVGSYSVPAGVTSIGDYAFRSCTGLTSVVIPASVTSIGTFAFAGCANLAIATFDGNAPTLGSKTFGEGDHQDMKTASDFTIYFQPGATGFNAPKWNGYPSKAGEPPAALEPAGPQAWTSKDGKTIKAQFVELGGESVVVRTEDGKDHKIPFIRLSAASVAQAKMFGRRNK
jgi:hypothetical protein